MQGRWVHLSAVVIMLSACGTPPQNAAGKAADGRPQAPSARASEYKAVEPIVTGDARTRAKAHTDLGLLYLGAGNFAVALQEAKLALQAESGYAPAYNLLAQTHLGLGEVPQAQEYFEKAYRLGPADPDIAVDYGMFLCLQGQERRAIDMFMSALKNPLYRTPTIASTNAGLCAQRLGDMQAAEQHFQRALMAEANNPAALLNLAELQYRRGGLVEARRSVSEFHRVVDAVPESVWLALRIERKLGDRSAEAGFASQLRRKFSSSEQYQAFLQGRFD